MLALATERRPIDGEAREEVASGERTMAASRVVDLHGEGVAGALEEVVVDHERKREAAAAPGWQALGQRVEDARRDRADDEHCVHGGILGSSQGAKRELIQVAPLLGIRLTKGKLSNREAAKINKEKESDTPFWIERQVWLTFYEEARLSIEYNTAIVFQ